MKTPLNVGALVAAAALAACQPLPVHTAAATVTRYQCEDGSVIDAVYPDTDSAHVVYRGRAIDMRIAVSADGARYTGGGWQWWTKGRTQGYLAPLAAGESIATAPAVACTAKSD